ncbi:low temperature requirement protein A [Subtercola endophyticus]|uniref:low temperature requirement protein A n=1 Tax=Subtercola endophyticus TaxID=2895559 RepID=UPI001E3FC491|nr:low temperature requirement protein A [Subtercola endophyticus]UFS60585.1 low temperature requirement protein A [Subtercola endophyticus]
MSEAGEASAAGAAVDGGRRVDWIELFFDLAMVAFITQLAHGLHGAPGPAEFATFVAWSIPAWWAWCNIMVCVNVLPELPRRIIGPALLAAMATIGVMAASVTVTADRAWAFALANVALRLILLGLWVYRARARVRASTAPDDRPHIARTVVYNGVTAVIWLVSVFVPEPVNFVLWGIAILIEVLLLRVGSNSVFRTLRVDVAHASERLGLFMIILMGESVLSLVAALSESFTPAAALAALLGFVAVGLIAWGFFVGGVGVIEQGLEALNERHSVAGLLDTVMFLPYLVVVSVTMFAAGLATAVADPTEPLSYGALVCLCGGLALFYATNALAVLRYGTPLRQAVRWASVGVLAPVLIGVILAFAVPGASGLLALALVAAAVVAVVLISAVSARRERLVRTS